MYLFLLHSIASEAEIEMNIEVRNRDIERLYAAQA